MQIAVAGVAVGDDRDANARRHAAHRLGHFGHAEKIQVRQAQHGGAGAKPADKHRFKAGLLDNQRGEHIVSPEAADDAGLLQQLT